MPLDEERLVNRNDDNEIEVIQNFDAARSSIQTNNDDDNTTATPAGTDSGYSETPSPSPQPLASKKRWFILEIPVFLVFLAMNLTGSIYTNKILYQTCVYVYHYNETDCEQLLGVERESPAGQSIETEIQPYVARILMTRSLIESIIPAIVSLFIGPWSDKFGRRPIILSTFTGYCTGYVILTILAFISTKVVITPWLFLLASLPSILTGGTCALITGIYCYISDVAKERTRAVRMILNEASLSAGMMVGNVVSGYLYAVTNVVTVFFISSCLAILALVYVIIFVKESLKPEDIQPGSKIREFFRFDLVKDLVRTCIERRPNFDRAIIWLTMLALTLAIFTMEGDANVTYLFVRKKFDWTLKEFNLFNASRIIVQIGGSIFGLVILRKIFKFSIVTLTMISFASSVLESTVRATAAVWWEMYLGLFLGIMRGIMGPMSRAILSHVTPANEVGKIFALTTSLECLSPLAAAPLYTIMYNATLSIDPGAFNFISASAFLLCYTLIATIYGIQKSLDNTALYQAIGS